MVRSCLFWVYSHPKRLKSPLYSFMASFLSRDTSFRAIVQVSVVAALHVGILVLSKDLGSAVIFFAAYLIMVYVATRNVGYLGLGIVGGSGAAVVAYHLFGHVRQRVSAWKDPMAVYQNEGYQIVQSLFAIGTGGWFGMGLCQGSPESIPVVKNDFIFSAICEELGGIFAICLILVCMSFFLMIVNIALRIINPFYKLIALGLGTEYAFPGFPYDRWCNQIYPYDRCNTPSCKLRRKFIIMHDPDAGNHSGTLYFKRRRGRGI